MALMPAVKLFTRASPLRGAEAWTTANESPGPPHLATTLPFSILKS